MIILQFERGENMTTDEKIDLLIAKIDTLETRLDRSEEGIADIKTTIESEIRTNILRVAEGNVETKQMLAGLMKSDAEIVLLTVNLNRLESELREVKRMTQ